MAELQAAVIGASGMGKHHAKWLARHGCEVGGFAGTSPESVTATTEALRDLFDFDGFGHVGVEPLLDAGEWDVISICSPHELHHEHFMAAVGTGAHIMCEKPLVFDGSLPAQVLLEQGEEMVAAAERAGIVAAINTQYVAAVGPYYELISAGGVRPAPPTEFSMQMESRGGDGGTTWEEIWVDLASHPLSVLMAFCGPGELLESTARCEVSERRVEAGFNYQPADGPLCTAEIVCHNRTEGDLVRRLGVNGELVDYAGRNDEQGVYRAYLSCQGRELAAQDFVEASVERFLQAVRGEAPRPLATLSDGLANLRMQLYLLDIAHRV